MCTLKDHGWVKHSVSFTLPLSCYLVVLLPCSVVTEAFILYTWSDSFMQGQPETLGGLWQQCSMPVLWSSKTQTHCQGKRHGIHKGHDDMIPFNKEKKRHKNILNWNPLWPFFMIPLLLCLLVTTQEQHSLGFECLNRVIGCFKSFFVLHNNIMS